MDWNASGYAKAMKLRSGLRTPELGGGRTRPRRFEMGDSEDKNNVKYKPDDMTAKQFKYEWPNLYIRGRQINCVLATVHFNIFMYATAFFISMGVLPYLNKKLGADPVTFGYLQTTFSVVQLAGGPPFGRFGDLFGGRLALTLAFAACAASYGIMSITYTIPLLFLSRLPSVFMHAMQGGQMIVTDMTEASTRADALGKLSFSYGIGMIVGPFIGGIINKHFGEQGAAFVAFVMSVASCFICLYFVPARTKQATKTAPTEEKASGASVFSIKKYLSLLKSREVCTLLVIKVIVTLPLGIFQSMFSVVVIENFKLSPDQNGYLMSYVGFIIMIMQGVGVGMLMKRFEEKNLIKWASFGLVWAWLLMSVVQNTLQFCIVIIPHCIFQVIINLIITSALTVTVADADSGAMLGMNMAMHALVRSVSPTTGGYMLQYFGFSSFGYLGSAMSALVTCYLFLKR